jgi:hypothetical protein
MPPAEPALPASMLEVAAFLDRVCFAVGVVVALGPGDDDLEAMIAAFNGNERHKS